MPSPFLHPHLGSISAIAQNFYNELEWLRAFKLNGGNVPIQFHWIIPIPPLYAGRTSLQSVLDLTTSLSLMQSLESTNLFFLGILNMWDPLPFHWMGHSLCLGVQTKPSSFGISRLVGLSKPSMAMLMGFVPPLFHLTAPQSLRDLWIVQFVCGILRQGCAIVS